MKKKLIILIILLISILLIYKNKDSFRNNDNVYFAFYNGNEKINEMPGKDNADGLVFNYTLCDNGANVVWNEEEWAPLIKNLTKNKTKCTLYFGPKPIELDKDIPLVESDDGLYKVEHNNLTELDSSWSKTEYRYAGVNPNNYVRFNNEIWRIIGLVNVQTENGVEQRIKIIRPNGIDGQKDFGNYTWGNGDLKWNENWTTSQLKDMLNGIYYESKSGECYTENSENTGNPEICDFSKEGLNENSRNMIDKDVIWNIHGYSDPRLNFPLTSHQFYEKERDLSLTNDIPSVWTNENDTSYHNGIGLMYPSDYGYATNGGSLGRESCLTKELFN